MVAFWREAERLEDRTLSSKVVLLLAIFYYLNQAYYFIY